MQQKQHSTAKHSSQPIDVGHFQFNNNFKVLLSNTSNSIQVGQENKFSLRTIAHAHETPAGNDGEISQFAVCIYLNLMASSDTLGIVKLWDFESFKLKGVLGNGGIDLTALAFAEPYPLLFTMDSSNNLLCYSLVEVFKRNREDKKVFTNAARYVFKFMHEFQRSPYYKQGNMALAEKAQRGRIQGHE